ncbi:MAG: glycosyltransferase family 2 protein [Parcubacteria group bacterium]
MKLIIQIPCYNEEKTLSLVLRDIPRAISGIDVIETQVIDDGSSDQTVAVARSLGVNHIVRYIGNKGLGNAFKRGVENALVQGADILVNTDGDNQYKSSDIPRLVIPIVHQRADIVIGNRQTGTIEHFSPVKKFFQWLGSAVTQYLSGLKIPDAVSGFRAYSREALLELNVTSDFSYVLDTIIQASKKRLKIGYVDITTNAPTRPSRLFKGIFQHIKKSTSNLLRVYAMYEPLKTFASLGTVFLLLGLYPMARYVFFYVNGEGSGHVQSLIIGAMCVIIGVQLYGLGVVGDLIAKQRRLTEDVLYRIKKTQADRARHTVHPNNAPPSTYPLVGSRRG